MAEPFAGYAFRQLSGRDVQLLKALLRVFGEAFADLPTYQDAVPSDAYLAELLSGAQFIALAALAGEEVVGGLAAYELVKFERERKEIDIYDLAVAAGHRRRGVAKGLINELKRIVGTRGICHLRSGRSSDRSAVALTNRSARGKRFIISTSPCPKGRSTAADAPI